MTTPKPASSFTWIFRLLNKLFYVFLRARYLRAPQAARGDVSIEGTVWTGDQDIPEA